MLWRLGVASLDNEADIALVQTIETALAESKVGIDRFFFDWAGGCLRKPSPADAVYASDALAPFRSQISDYTPSRVLDHAYWSRAEPVSMPIEIVEQIWSHIVEDDDWSALEAQIADIRIMGEALRR